MPELTLEERRRNVERVARVGERLGEIENKLLAAQAMIPVMAREIAELRDEIKAVLSGAPGTEESDG